ncbi:ornithine cyclodeaminase family protein [Candidatus Pantoea multigeneris]|uniref:Ornithine cyclodeaminase n=1 Tax=Candidatus Pantoea multigeneris TaxID=2608357 RepID=A0ABX0RDY5_9GAMM|nr:ornithine cyclodeaminase [Pantoea multigeneris]NIF23570.1 ornithine cyclodeaminase [Pantoea multigeneris]
MCFISETEICQNLSWDNAISALHQGHLGDRPVGGQFFAGDAQFGLFSRGVILPGYGAGIKLASIYPENVLKSPPLPAEHAAFVVFDALTQEITAILDGPAITRYKTAADSALAAKFLSREDSKVLLVIGAGPIAQALAHAYLHVRPTLEKIILWNRSPQKLGPLITSLQDTGREVSLASDLDSAVRQADIITSATSAIAPLIEGRWVQPGTHIDLVGGFREDMQEADASVMQKARIFVDDREAALRSGDLFIPLRDGYISQEHIDDDLFGLCQTENIQRRKEDITVFKNAGGAHLDLLISQEVIRNLSL